MVFEIRTLSEEDQVRALAALDKRSSPVRAGLAAISGPPRAGRWCGHSDADVRPDEFGVYICVACGTQAFWGK